jgi:ferrochelatase
MAQADALRARLGAGVPVAVGMRNWRPFIKDALEDLVRQGATRIVGVPMAPQFSTLSVQKYVDAARAALPSGVQFDAVTSYHAHPRLLEAFAERVRTASVREDETVVFTAHSLPVRVIEGGDVYADEVAATARGVADLAGIGRFDTAYQSAGRTPEPWIGPDLGELITARAAAGARRFLIVPVGFVCDHTEILFDVDVQAARTARDAGASLRRTESLNTSPAFIGALEEIVRARL